MGKKKRTYSDADICYTIVNIFLDGKVPGGERTRNLNPRLREVLQKITALQMSVKIACSVRNDGKPLDDVALVRQCLEHVKQYEHDVVMQ